MSLLTNFARGVKVELIAKLATSYEAYDGGTLIKGVARHNIRDYFRKYGSTARKFDHIAEDDIYIGYVRMSYKPEFLSAIILAGENAVAVSFDSEVGESNDFLTLMAKKEFADRMTVAVQRAASFMRKPTSPPAPQPQAKPIAPPPTAPAQKSNDALGWIALLTVGAIFGAIVLIPLLVENSFSDSTASAPDRDYAFPAGQYETLPANSERYDPLLNPSGEQPPNRAVEEDVPTEGSQMLTMTAITLGVGDFTAVYRSDGMLGAVAESVRCHELAGASNDINILDRCAAFDFAAEITDQAIMRDHQDMLNEYFSSTNGRLESAYARFPRQTGRLAAVNHMTANAISDLVNSTD